MIWLVIALICALAGIGVIGPRLAGPNDENYPYEEYK